MNKTLFLYELKKDIKMLCIFAAILTMYIASVIWLYDPEMMKSLEQIYTSMPQLMNAMGMKASAPTLIGFMISYLYGFIFLVIPLVYILLRAKSLLVDKVEKNSMATLLSAPVSRRKIAVTQIVELVVGIVIMLVFSTAMEIIFSEIWFAGDLDVLALIKVNIGLLTLLCFIASLCMFGSTFCNESEKMLGASGGFCLVMYLINMIKNTGISDDLEKLKYITFFTLFEPEGLVEGTTKAITGSVTLAVASLIVFITTVVVFEKKDLVL